MEGEDLRLRRAAERRIVCGTWKRKREQRRRGHGPRLQDGGRGVMSGQTELDSGWLTWNVFQKVRAELE